MMKHLLFIHPDQVRENTHLQTAQNNSDAFGKIKGKGRKKFFCPIC